MFCCVCLHTKSVHVGITLIYSILGRWGLEYCFLPKTFKIILPIYFLCKQQVENYSLFFTVGNQIESREVMPIVQSLYPE
jgi:hypothetical protein